MSFFNSNITGSAGGSGGATGGLVTKFEKSVTISSNELAEVTINLSEDVSNYADITNEQIIVELANVWSNHQLGVHEAKLTHSYNSETGDLTLTSTSSYMPFRGDSGSTINLIIYVTGAVQLPPAVIGDYQVTEGYASISNYNSKSYLDVLTNEVITGSIADKTVIGTGDDIIIATYAHRATAGTDVGQPFTSATNVKLIPLINGAILNNYIPCKGVGANEEYGGYSSIAILVADDSSKPFSVTSKDGAWTSSSLIKLSKV